MCKDGKMKLVLDQLKGNNHPHIPKLCHLSRSWEGGGPESFWGPSLATRVRGELLIWWRILWGHRQCAGSPFSLLNTYTLEISRVLPPSSSQQRGLSHELTALRASWVLSAVWGTQWAVSDPYFRILKARSYGRNAEWGGLAGNGLCCLYCWDKIAYFLWTRGGVCLQRSQLGVILTPAPKNYLEWAHVT